jgi:hypothetical protein
MLTRDELLGIVDLNIKEIVVPDHIPGWGGRTLYIKQLTRGQQDTYLRRQYGETRMKQDQRANNQEISAVNIFGHDSWIVSQGACNEDGKRIFQDDDVKRLDGKNGEAIGWIAEQIIIFSGMKQESDLAKGMTPEQTLEEELKN